MHERLTPKIREAKAKSLYYKALDNDTLARAKREPREQERLVNLAYRQTRRAAEYIKDPKIAPYARTAVHVDAAYFALTVGKLKDAKRLAKKGLRDKTTSEETNMLREIIGEAKNKERRIGEGKSHNQFNSVPPPSVSETIDDSKMDSTTQKDKPYLVSLVRDTHPLIWAYGIASIGDMVTTHIGLANGAHEGNRIFSYLIDDFGEGSAYVVRSILTVGLMILLKKCYSIDKKFGLVAAAGLDAVTGLTVASNFLTTFYK